MSETEQLRLRPATIDDLDAVWGLETAVFGAQSWSRDMMVAELSGEHREYLVVVDRADRVVGFGGILVLAGDGDIQTIALDPTVRSVGHGRHLMNALLDAASARGATRVFLEVRADNPIAIKLYASLGFERIGTRPHYYQPEGVDAIAMKLEMKDRR